MTGEEMERAIELLLHNQAKNSAEIMSTNEAVNRLAEAVGRDRVENRALLEAHRRETREQVEAIREQVEAYRQETREHIDNLIIANEVTRNLAEQVARLAVTTSQRVTALENK